MIPDYKFVKINTDDRLIEQFIEEIILLPRLNILKWSIITKQSSALKIGYAAQYLASLITGVEGSRSAARGDDLCDGTEVKGCNRIDQLDTCKNCKGKVSRYESKCFHCNSVNIDRKDDSKWLISIRSEQELDLYINKINRFLFIIMHYPNFYKNNFEEISIQAFEIWPLQNPEFQQLLKEYYHNIYCEHVRQNPSKTPAPKNFWPFSFQFYKCKPRKVYDCTILNVNTSPIIQTNFFFPPTQDRSLITPEAVPFSILSKSEKEIIYRTYHQKFEDNSLIPHNYLDILPLRETSNPIIHTKPYSRR
jgi:mamI restriction endonuclease